MISLRTDPVVYRRRARWCQFSLRNMLLAVIPCALGAAVLAEALRREGVPAVEGETGSGGCRGRGIGRWGLFVPGLEATRAGRLLDAILKDSPPSACGDACADPAGGVVPRASDSPGAPGDPDYPVGDDAWPEDGDWWKSGQE